MNGGRVPRSMNKNNDLVTFRQRIASASPLDFDNSLAKEYLQHKDVSHPILNQNRSEYYENIQNLSKINKNNRSASIPNNIYCRSHQLPKLSHIEERKQKMKSNKYNNKQRYAKMQNLDWSSGPSLSSLHNQPSNAEYNYKRSNIEHKGPVVDKWVQTESEGEAAILSKYNSEAAPKKILKPHPEREAQHPQNSACKIEEAGSYSIVVPPLMKKKEEKEEYAELTDSLSSQELSPIPIGEDVLKEKVDERDYVKKRTYDMLELFKNLGKAKSNASAQRRATMPLVIRVINTENNFVDHQIYKNPLSPLTEEETPSKVGETISEFPFRSPKEPNGLKPECCNFQAAKQKVKLNYTEENQKEFYARIRENLVDPLGKKDFLQLLKDCLRKEKKLQFSEQPAYKQIISTKIKNIYLPADEGFSQLKVCSIYIYI